MIRPDTYLLREIPWQTFSTLTFQGRLKGDDARARALFGFNRDVAKSYLIPDRFFLWASRDEQGEKFGRPHFHCLHAGLCDPAKGVTIRDIHRLRMMWVRLGFGFAMVRRFRNGADGIDYLTKPGLVEHSTEADGLTLATLRKTSRSTAGADRYEFGKFDSQVSGLQVSSAVWFAIAKKRSVSLSGREVRRWKDLSRHRPAA